RSASRSASRSVEATTRLRPGGRVGRARSQARPREGVTPMASYTEGHLPIAGIDLHFYRMGTQGRPPAVFLHGFSDGGLTWLRLARDLGPDYDLVMLDAAGHGRSGGVEHGFRERAAADVLAAIERLELDRPALVGHSMGAGTASAVAVQASDRLRGVALEDPGWWDGDRPPTLRAAPDAAGSRPP